MNFVFLYATAKDIKEAKSISKNLLEKKLIACSNMFPIESMYLWQGKIKEEKEVVLILKTIRRNVAKVKEEILRIHSYSLPCITEISVNPNEKYAEWLIKTLKNE